jgi:Pyruvate/2-oxoacid:ferredoxin oxidoreductase delta subunit
MEGKDPYIALRERLDTLKGVGFPAVPGADVAFLKKIFTEDEAKIFVVMDDKFQSLEEVAERLGRKPEDTKVALDRMADKGVVMTSTKTDPVFYAPLPWLTGWGDWIAYWEDRETAELEEIYKKGAFSPTQKRRRNIFRTLPIYETIPDKNTVASYDDVRKVLEKGGTISVADCYCDRHRKLREQSVHEPLERCFLFGKWAEFLIEKGFGRKVSTDEAMEILNKCRDAGLVHNTLDSQNPVYICNCGEHCGGNMSRRVVPGVWSEYEQTSNYQAKVDADLCAACEECVQSCWLKAINMNEGVAEIRTEICVGCGVCVTKCAVGALSLEARPNVYVPKQTHPQAHTSEEYEAELAKYKYTKLRE